MSRRSMSYEVTVNGAARRVELPFVCGVLGEFSGQPSTPLPALQDRRFVSVDRDNIDAVLASIRPRVAFTVPGEITSGALLTIDLTFASLADFAPDRVLARVPELRRLLDHRAALGPKMDLLLNRQLALIMHHPEFRQLEATWRGLHRLVTRWDRCDEVSVRLWDISKRELARSLNKFRGTSWDHSPLFKKVFHEAVAEGRPFTLLVGCYDFDHSPQDTQMLSDLSQVAAACQAPFLAAASPMLLQMEEWTELDAPRDLGRIMQTPEYTGWRSLRESADSSYLVLTLPRYVARAAWEPEEPATSYQFREPIGGPAQIIWGHTALLLAENVIQSFLLHGWACHITGLTTGGAVEALPECVLDGARRSVEIRVDARREQQLQLVGLTALVARDTPGLAEFTSAVCLAQPVDAATDTSLAAIMILCRLNQYVRALLADGVLRADDTAASQQWFDAWIAPQIEPPPGSVARWSASRPLLAAKLVEPSEYRSSFSVQASANPRYWGGQFVAA